MLLHDASCSGSSDTKYDIGVIICQPRTAAAAPADMTCGRLTAVDETNEPTQDDTGFCNSPVFENIKSAVQCAALCTRDTKPCRSVYFNKKEKKCILMLFADAKVDLKPTENWKKYKIDYLFTLY